MSWHPIETLREWLDSRPGDDALFEIAEFREGKLMHQMVCVVRDVVWLHPQATHWRQL